MGATQDYEAQIAAVSTQMKALEHLLVEQRMKGNSLENQLSAAQDRIGGAERRAQQLEEENRQIKSELQYWNDYYAQEEEEEVTAEVQSAPEIGNPAAVSCCSVPIPSWRKFLQMLPIHLSECHSSQTFLPGLHPLCPLRLWDLELQHLPPVWRKSSKLQDPCEIF